MHVHHLQVEAVVQHDLNAGKVVGGVEVSVGVPRAGKQTKQKHVATFLSVRERWQVEVV